MLDADIEVGRRDFTVALALTVEPGERLALFGPSGAGKTTTLEAVAGLVPLRRGRIAAGGRVLTQTWAPRCAVPPWQRRVGLLRQNPGLFPHLSVRQNLAYGAGRRPSVGVRREAAGQPASFEIARLAAELGIDGLLDDRPARLSGGQAHRVALGRLLASHCEALLLDEPYTGLDAGLRQTLTGMVRTLASERGVPTILVSHELADAQAFASRLVILDRGRVLQDGAPADVVRRPASRRVAELVGYRGFVPAGAAASAPAAGPHAGGAAAGAPAASPDAGGALGIVAGIHPERVVPGAHPESGLVLTGQVLARRPSGAGWEADVQLPTTVITCRFPDWPAEGSLTVTALDPPWFGPDGALLPHGHRART